MFGFLFLVAAQVYRPGARGTGGFAFINESNLARDRKMLSHSRARQMLELSNNHIDRAAWHRDVVVALTNLAKILDESVTRYEVEYEIGDHLHRVFTALEKQDKKLKRRCEAIDNISRSLKVHIDDVVKQTNAELEQYMKHVRKEIVSELRNRVQSLLTHDQKDLKLIHGETKDVIDTINLRSKLIAIIYFCVFQILMFVCIYITIRYLKISY